MFSLTVRDHVMIAHSLPHPSFGPAQSLHGATFVVELTVRRSALTPEATVIDIGEASALLADALADLNYRNLDDHPELQGKLTTTETLAEFIAQRLTDRLSGRGIEHLEVTLREHPDAWASFETALPR